MIRRKSLYSALSLATVVTISSVDVALTAEMPKLIRAALNSHNLVKEFNVSPGLTGWALTNNQGDGLILYSTDDGKIIKGDMFDSAGNNMTTQYYLKYIPEKPKTDVSELDYIEEGEGESLMYVFFDPNCPACNDMWLETRQYLNVVKIRWVPVAFVSETSAAAVHAILNAANPRIALGQYETQGRIPGMGEVSEKTKRSIEANRAMMHEYDLKGTPGGVLITADGTRARFDSLNILSVLAGLQ